MKKVKLLTCGVLALALSLGATSCSSTKVEEPEAPAETVVETPAAEEEAATEEEAAAKEEAAAEEEAAAKEEAAAEEEAPAKEEAATEEEAPAEEDAAEEEAPAEEKVIPAKIIEPAIVPAPEGVVNPIVNVDGMEVSSYIRTWPIGTTKEQMDEGKHWTADDVKGEYLTELIVAFAHVDQDTWGIKFPDAEPEDPEATPFPELWDEVAKLKARYPHMSMNVSVGGYGADGFSEMAADYEKRTAFIDAIVNLVLDKDLDGIDIDWEYPIGPDWGQEISCSPDDGVNFLQLLKEMRGAFNAIEHRDGKYVKLSIAAPASGWYVQKMADVLPEIVETVDTIKLMTYDYYGSWSGQAGHAANLYTNPADPDWGGWSTDATVKTYLNAGVPAEKLILGLAFYGRGWDGVEPGPNGDGLYQKYEQSVFEDGLSWSDMINFANDECGFKYYWDDVAKAPYLYNEEVGGFITFTDPRAVQEIGKYALENNLGGVMVWEYGHDYRCELFPILVESVDTTKK